MLRIESIIHLSLSLSLSLSQILANGDALSYSNSWVVRATLVGFLSSLSLYYGL